MKSVIACSLSLTLVMAGPALAGTWSCGQGCDIASLKGISWTPGTKCQDANEPEIKTSSPKAYNESADLTNKWIAKKQEYLKCLSEELNGDFQTAQNNMQESARSNFEGIQKAFADRVEQISKQLDEAAKKLAPQKKEKQ